MFFMKAKREALTAPVLLSKLQSGMIFERVTIQLLILSLLLLSTANRHRKKRKYREGLSSGARADGAHLRCAVLFASHLWVLVNLQPSCKGRKTNSKELLEIKSLLFNMSQTWSSEMITAARRRDGWLLFSLWLFDSFSAL